MTADRVLDRAHLSAQTFGDAALADELLALFAAQCQRLVPLAADASRPALARAEAAHTLRGAALAVGAAGVAAASAALEVALTRGTDEAGPAASLTEAADAIRREIVPGLPSTSPRS